MSLSSATVAAAGQTALKFCAGLVLLKVLALYLGPARLALFGQVQSSFILISGVAALFASNGLTSLMAAERHDSARQASVMGTAIAMSVGAALCCCVALPILNMMFGRQMFGAPLADWLIALLAAGVMLQTSNVLVVSAFTARREMKMYGVLTSVAPILLMGLAVALAPTNGFQGAAASLALSAICAGIVTIAVGRRRLAIPWRELRWDAAVASPLMRFGAFGVVSLIATPLSQIFIRQILSTDISSNAAGTWYAAMRLSEALLAPVATLLTIYMLPRQAAADAASAYRATWTIATRLLPIALVVVVVLFLLRHGIVRNLFSAEFLGMTSYLQFQFAGDVVRVLGWVFSYTLLARGLALRLAVLEALHAVLWPTASAWLAQQGDVAAASKGYLLSNFVYLVLACWLTHLSLGRRPRETASSTT